MFLPIPTDDPEPVTSPFEQWCASVGLHPEDSRAWPLYEARVAVKSQTPAAS